MSDAPITNGEGTDRAVKRVSFAVEKQMRPICPIAGCKNTCANRGISKKTGERKIGRFCSFHKGTYAAGAFLNHEGKLARQRKLEKQQKTTGAQT